MICPHCREQGKKSQVTKGLTISSLVDHPTGYDQDGNLQQGGRNTKVTNYRCSEGHKFTVEE